MIDCYCFACSEEGFIEWFIETNDSIVEETFVQITMSNRRNRSLIAAASERLKVETYSALIEICADRDYGCLREVLRFIRTCPEPVRIYVK